MWCLFLAAASLLVVAGVLWRSQPRGRDTKTGAILAVLAISEVWVWSATVMPTFDLRDALPTLARQVLQGHPGDYRYFRMCGIWDNSAMGMHTYDLWGYESFKLRRFCQFMAWTQGRNPDDIDFDFYFTRNSPYWALLRCRYIFVENQGPPQVHEIPEYLPHVLLVGACRQMAGRDAIFAAMKAPEFDPRRQVLLESTPNPLPQARGSSSPGTAVIVASGTDYLDIDATATRPCILLVTDSYAHGWRAVGLPGSVQRQYDVMPGDYILRAIPLQAGQHHILLYYRPLGYVLGAWISAISLIAFAALAGRCWRKP
jgi:hypothetical protein